MAIEYTFPVTSLTKYLFPEIKLKIVAKVGGETITRFKKKIPFLYPSENGLS